MERSSGTVHADAMSANNLLHVEYRCQEGYMKNSKTELLLSISLLLSFFASCSCISYIRGGENGYRRYQAGKLCKNEVVTRFDAVLTNRDILNGKEKLRCFKGSDQHYRGLTRKEELRSRLDAEKLFYSICESDLTMSANLILKGRYIKVVEKGCNKHPTR